MVLGSERMINKKRGLVISLPIPLKNFGYKVVTGYSVSNNS
jgi:hypothetical protein